MNRLRLIPVVIFATAALLVIKTMALVSAERASPPPMTIAAAPAPAARTVPETDLEFTGSMPAKKEEPPKKEEPKGPPLPPKAPETPAGINVGVPGEVSPAQKALLARLQQRRMELDQRQRDLELRENLIRDAEQRLEARLNELRAIENPSAENEQPQSQRTKNLVIMYEGMKPKDAARIFEKLDMKVLVEVARAMKPIKLSEVLAVMNPDAAQRLTVELARGGSPDKATPPGDLQRVNVPPPAPGPQTRASPFAAQQKNAPQKKK